MGVTSTSSMLGSEILGISVMVDASVVVPEGSRTLRGLLRTFTRKDR